MVEVAEIFFLQYSVFLGAVGFFTLSGVIVTA
jgi:hypothetical protein